MLAGEPVACDRALWFRSGDECNTTDYGRYLTFRTARSGYGTFLNIEDTPLPYICEYDLGNIRNLIKTSQFRNTVVYAFKVAAMSE